MFGNGIDLQTFGYGKCSETGTKHNRRLYNAIETQPLDTHRIRKRNRNTAAGYAFRTESEHNRRTYIIPGIYIGNGIGNKIAASIFGKEMHRSTTARTIFRKRNRNTTAGWCIIRTPERNRTAITWNIFGNGIGWWLAPRMYSETESKQRPKSALAALNTKTSKDKMRRRQKHTYNPSPKKKKTGPAFTKPDNQTKNK